MFFYFKWKSREKINRLSNENIIPGLAVILAGDNLESKNT